MITMKVSSIDHNHLCYTSAIHILWNISDKISKKWKLRAKNVHIKLAKKGWTMMILSNFYQSYLQENEIKGICV